MATHWLHIKTEFLNSNTYCPTLSSKHQLNHCCSTSRPLNSSVSIVTIFWRPEAWRAEITTNFMFWCTKKTNLTLPGGYYTNQSSRPIVLFAQAFTADVHTDTSMWTLKCTLFSLSINLLSPSHNFLSSMLRKACLALAPSLAQHNPLSLSVCVF